MGDSLNKVETSHLGYISSWPGLQMFYVLSIILILRVFNNWSCKPLWFWHNTVDSEQKLLQLMKLLQQAKYNFPSAQCFKCTYFKMYNLLLSIIISDLKPRTYGTQLFCVHRNLGVYSSYSNGAHTQTWPDSHLTAVKILPKPVTKFTDLSKVKANEE